MTNRRDLVAQALGLFAPATPGFERAAILDHALDSSGLRTASPQAAAWLSLVTYIRHAHTDYDALLAEGYGPEAARFFVRDEINAVLAAWGCRRQVQEQ